LSYAPVALVINISIAYQHPAWSMGGPVKASNVRPHNSACMGYQRLFLLSGKLEQRRGKTVGPADLPGGTFAGVSGAWNHGVSFCGMHWQRFLVFRKGPNPLVGHKTPAFTKLG